MPSKTYTYFPPTGPLPGKSFEKQTVEFFEGLQEQVDTMGVRISNIEKRSGSELSQILSQLSAMQTSLASLRTAVVNAQNMALAAKNAAEAASNKADGAQTTADKALEGIVPTGGIILTQQSSVATGWKLADGSSSTPNLANYATSPLKYIQRG